ncbi:LptF/LptG family permease [Litoribacter ruber]|uniref:LptF/LptG family permease n=1 Tax=Litoribacter ruber TaxID=702568 RepID=UPI001BD93683|nr:LptF/LptG family permease [Litoribacter ruber]MBT0810277.1 LptF/LptG family permease [Litoribacter ruber]
MKKLDKLILGSFIGPFLLTFIVVDFILLIVNMLKYFDEIFGKGLSFSIYMELISYFVISISPMALPLAVLLSALMTFGNLGEHFELTAIKSSGISLLRALLPIGIFVVILTFFAYLSNNYLVPRVNLKTFSLLYDIRMKSPALDIQEGVFYNGIPNYSIKVNRKLDDVTLKDIIIYDHSSGQGNTSITMADSGRMEPFFNDRYMKLTLFHGNSYQESGSHRGIKEKPVDFSRTSFNQNEMVFSLDAFNLNRTTDDQWSNNRSIKNIREIRFDLDSMGRDLNSFHYYNYINTESNYSYFTKNRKLTAPRDILAKKERADSIRNERWKQKLIEEAKQVDSVALAEGDSTSLEEVDLNIPIDHVELFYQEQDFEEFEDDEEYLEGMPDSLAAVDTLEAIRRGETAANQPDTTTAATADTVAPETEEEVASEILVQQPVWLSFSEKKIADLDSLFENSKTNVRGASIALNSARTMKNQFNIQKTKIDNLEREFRRFEIAWYQKYTQAFACIVMFMIGAPLGAIIKKGGLGMPVLFSIIFFIIFYMLTITGEKWAKEGIVDPLIGTWFANLCLIPVGFFFLKQARKDARLFEAELYQKLFSKIKGLWGRFGRKRSK